MKPARVILIDKPQPYRNRHDTRKDNPEQKTRFGSGVAARYNHGVMSEYDIIRLGDHIREIAAPDAYILHWVTKPNWPFDFRLLGETNSPGLWGLEYKTTPFVWVKRNRRADTQFCGGGSYNFSNVEDVVLARYPNTPIWHPNNPEFKPKQTLWSEDILVLTDEEYSIEMFEPHERYPDDPDDPTWLVRFPAAPDHFEHAPFPNTKEGRALREATCFRCHNAGKIAHSRKPETVQTLIDLWLDPYIEDYSKVELFATRQRTPDPEFAPDAKPWICLGGDVTGNHIVDDMRAMSLEIRMG